jgi:hypothetical protein
VVRLADLFVPFFAVFLSAIAKHLPAPNESQPLGPRGSDEPSRETVLASEPDMVVTPAMNGLARF